MVSVKFMKAQNKLAKTLHTKGDMESFNEAQRAAGVLLEDEKLLKRIRRGMKP